MKQRENRHLSRRGLIAGVAVAPLLGASARSERRPTPAPSGAAGKLDPSIELARHCLALHRETERLHRRWGDAEDWLADNHDWLKLTEAQQRALPAARRLLDIDGRLAVLGKESSRALRRLRRTPATSIAGVVGKLQVIAAAIEPDEFPSAYRLLMATIRDLHVLQGS